MPCQNSAFYAGRHVGDVLQSDGIFQFFQLVIICDFPFDHIQEEVDQAQGFFDGLALDEVDHDVRRSLADGTAVAGIGGVFDDAVLDVGLEGDVITTAGVMAVFAEVSIFQGMFVFLTLIVFQDDVGIQFVHIFHDSLSP